ncbi:aldo/keto reductase [Echinicola sp. CAU 1574]|uniref:Aldo/keto reductase n=1 Tax=Echinicola arenosa TaxID=2774144 RepID=A0ABR9AF00_9BACT|nr:aldo/keto reductase [Echinicola arenosa]MBD8487380.1 aldo/keto reductase [Echinicola arenosa]
MTMTQVGLGLAALGRPEYINVRSDQNIDKSLDAFQHKSMEVLDKAYTSGIRYFDTAPSYGKGEQFLLEWHLSRQHPDVLLSTKWGYTYKANWELGYEGAHEVKEHSLAKLKEQWAFSKQFLPSLGIYQIHSATFESGVLENRDVHKELLRIKMDTGVKIGMSTSGKSQSEILKAAMEVKVEGEILFDSFQVTFNILEQSTLPALKKAQKLGKTIIIKEGLANGRIFPNSSFKHYAGRYDKLKKIATHYHVGVDALALRFIMDFLQPDYVLSGAGNTKQLEENLMSNHIQLSNSDLQVMREMEESVDSYWDERSSLKWN